MGALISVAAQYTHLPVNAVAIIQMLLFFL